jgi:release factor glutamine methyltransferase
MALEGGADGLEVVRQIVTGAPGHLVPGGVLALEVGAGQAPSALDLLRGAGFREVAARRDYGGIERVVSGVLQTR